MCSTVDELLEDGTYILVRYGYVNFMNQSDAANAIENMNQQVFEGRRMTVQYSFRKDSTDSRARPNPTAPSKTLFIGNMSFQMTDQDLNELFRDIRDVVDVRVAIDRRTGQPRGFAHADFLDVASAMKALKQLNDKEVYGRRLRIDYSQSSPKINNSRS